MGLDFIDKAIKITLILGTLCFLVASSWWSFADGLGVFSGALWSCLNIFLIKHMMQNLLVSPRDGIRLFTLVGIKFPVLYLIGYGLLTNPYLPIWPLLLGTTLIFAVIFLKGFQVAFLSKAVICFLPLLSTASLSASLDIDVPEVPNLFSLLNKIFYDSPFFEFLRHWDSIIFSFAIAIGISLLFHLGARKKELIPSKFQNVLEFFVEHLRYAVIEIIGPGGEKYVPLLGTLFIYILTMNYLVLIPFMKAPSSNFNITVALAICVFVLVQYLNIRNYGFFGFLYHLAGSPKNLMGWILVPLMLPIEILTQFSRPVTLSLRLFGNVVGEDILIGAAALFGVYILSDFNAPVGFPMQIPFMFLALLTGLMQALVFTLLSAVYIMLSIPHKDEHGLH